MTNTNPKTVEYSYFRNCRKKLSNIFENFEKSIFNWLKIWVVLYLEHIKIISNLTNYDFFSGCINFLEMLQRSMNWVA